MAAKQTKNIKTSTQNEVKFGQIARLVEKYLQTGETGIHYQSQTNKKEKKTISVPS